MEQVLEIRNLKSSQLNAILEGEEESLEEEIPPVTTSWPTVDTVTTETPLGNSTVSEEPTEEAVGVSSFPLESKTHRRAQRRTRELERRRLREELSQEGG